MTGVLGKNIRSCMRFINIISRITKAFSLVELMVVIAIIGILAAVAIPSYRNDIIKTKIASCIPILQHMLDAAIESNDINGYYPASLSVYNLSFSNASFVAFDSPPIVYLRYVHITNGVMTCATLSDMGIPGFTSGTIGKYSRICMVAYNNNNIYVKGCGGWGDVYDTPTAYLPPKCKCKSLSLIYNGGTDPSC